MESEQLLRIIHFNDVYDIEPGDKDPVGGVARFKTATTLATNQNTIVLFSGDAFSPSLLTDVHRGKQMIKPLNSLNIDVACLGNHDLDFPMEEALELQRGTNFPWLLSNFFLKGTTDRLLDTKEYHILEKGGFRIGLFGLAEEEWEDVLTPMYYGKLDYVNFVEYGELMVNTLREDHQCNFIIALTHMMGYNDTKLAQSVKGIDLILGGHDHTIRSQQIKQTPIIKSGTNFKHFSIISVRQDKGECKFHTSDYGVDVKLVSVVKDIHPDTELQQHVNSFWKELEEERNQVAIVTDCDIDLRFEIIRAQESPYLRLVAEWYRHLVPCDVVFLNAGNMRNNAIYHKGPLLKKDIFNQVLDEVVAKLLSGKQILQALENAVSLYPNLSGRFTHFSGVTFTWDHTQPEFKRVVQSSIRVNGQPLDLNHTYVTTCHAFQASGGDGFSCFLNTEYAFKSPTLLQNSQILSTMTNPNDPEAKEFARLHPLLYRIEECESSSMIHINPGVMDAAVTMI